VKGPERFQVGLLNLSGTIVQDKSSFSVTVNGTTQYTTPNLNIVKPTGPFAQALGVRAPRNSINVQGLLDYAVTRDQTLRIGFNQLHNSADNLGIGAYDEPERAYSTNDSTTNLRIQLTGPLGRRMFTNTRLNVTQVRTEQSSALEAPTIQVLDAFTSGGAQMAGRRTASSFTFATDLDYVRGRHSLRTGMLVNGGAWTSTLDANYLGTYTFPSLAAFLAGTPSNYSRRIGDPRIGYSMLDAGVYVQDDVRVRPGLMISPGVRYEVQQHGNDWKDVGPRIGLTWAPFSSGSTSIRASAGVFYDFLSQATLEQVLRVDGSHEQELNIVNPSFPEPGDSRPLLPVNRYFLDRRVQSPRSTRFSTGVEHTFRQSRTFTVRGNVLYAYTRTAHAWRGVDENAPINGVRPDPGLANVVDVASDASARQHQLTVGWNIGLPPQPPGNETSKWFTWNRFALYGQETMTLAHNNTDGDFAVSPTGTLAEQWGRSILDVPSRLAFNVISMQIRRTQIVATLTQQSGLAFSETTGLDTNSDGIFNERRPGIARNSLRGADQWALSIYGNYTIPLRRRATPVTGLVATQFSGSTVSGVGTFSDTTRYRVSFIVQAQNLTNRSNYVGYSGVLTSPFFAQPTAVTNPRRVLFDIVFSF
jgi:hypothetical protein